ncbi:MAG TPA: hypothetical protein VMD04_01105, partial [Candidatus Margulisiibacteriota bacterium]|nr:hypothetical protein [Candidatus Margulisiibacteriota bacterium]
MLKRLNGVAFSLAAILIFCASVSAEERASLPEKFKFSLPFGKNADFSDILVTRAVDGDTLVLEGGERVRLIGIDTPEMHESAKLYRDAQRSHSDIAVIQAMGRRAYKFTRNLVEGRRV